MNREINISKSQGATVVAITSNGKTSTTSYTREADIFLIDSNSIAVVIETIPFLVFRFSEIENNFGAVNATEYHEVMIAQEFFKRSSSGGGGDSGRYIKIEGYDFEYRPIPVSNGNDFEIGDLALNGWISENQFGKILAYTGGNPTLFSSWEVLESI